MEGRIEYYGSNGQVGETQEFETLHELADAAVQELEHGAPLGIVLYIQQDAREPKKSVDEERRKRCVSYILRHAGLPPKRLDYEKT